MRGVDRMDQMIGYYNMGRQSKEWWKCVFTYIVECSILNAHVLFSCQNPSSQQLKFRFLERTARGESRKCFMEYHTLSDY